MVRMPDGSMRPNYPPQNYPMHGPYGPRMHPGMHPYGPRGPMPPPGSVGPDGRPVRPEMGVRMPDGSPMRPQMVRMPDGSMRPMGPMDSRMMGPRGPMDPRMMGPGHPEMVRMPDGSMRPMGPMDSRMMGPRGPMDPRVMGPRGPMDPRMMGPRGPMPPPHPIQMEMQHIHQQLNHLHSQNPQENPQIQEQVCILASLQNSRLVRNQDFFFTELYEYTDDYKYYNNHIISYLFHDLHFCNILCSTPKLRFSE